MKAKLFFVVFMLSMSFFTVDSYAQIEGFYPEVDMIYAGGECSPPGIKYSLLVSSPVRDSILISSVPDEWQSRMWYFDSSGNSHVVDNVYFISIDSSNKFNYEIWYHHNKSPSSIPMFVPFDSLFVCDSQHVKPTFHLQLVVKKQNKIVDSLSQLFYAEFGLAIESEKIPLPKPDFSIITSNYSNSLIPISYTLAEPSLVNMTVYSSKGRVIKAVMNNYKNAGMYTQMLRIDDFSSGMYLLKYAVNNHSAIKRFYLFN